MYEVFICAIPRVGTLGRPYVDPYVRVFSEMVLIDSVRGGEENITLVPIYQRLS